jgi:phosphinothricin acetyltransferase
VETKIRQAELKDINKILDIVNYEIINSTVVYDYEIRTYEQQLKWFKQKQADGMPLIVTEIENEVVGFGTYGIFRSWAAYQFSVEHSIYIDKNSRGRGIGKQLLSELIELAKAGGYHIMIAGIDSSNNGSFEFHKKFGFEEIGTFREVGFKFGKWLDLHFLQLFLG